MSSSPNRRVHIDTVSVGDQSLQNFRNQNRDVKFA